jgi:two-component system nitrogen regulation sensor histidine kinase GlnL
LAASPAQAESVLDQLDTGVVRLDGAGRIEFMNSAAEQALLVSRDRASGRFLFEVAFIPPELSRAIHRVVEEPQGVRLHEVKLESGLFDCVLRNLNEGAILLEMQNLEWEQMRARLQQREVQTGMLELLSRNLGHEVRNPLGGIRGAAQMLADELQEDELAMLARLIMRESDRIDELIQRFGQPELDLQEMQLYPLLDEALDLLQAEYGDEVSVSRDFDPSIPALRADASSIRQVLLNLLRNACQAGATQIALRTRVEMGQALQQNGSSTTVRIDFMDNGQGVPESLRSLLFLPLVTGRRDGTGLGLSLSQQIASAHGGLLTFEPREQGSCFTLYLPIGHIDHDEAGI